MTTLSCYDAFESVKDAHGRNWDWIFAKNPWHPPFGWFVVKDHRKVEPIEVTVCPVCSHRNFSSRAYGTTCMGSFDRGIMGDPNKITVVNICVECKTKWSVSYCPSTRYVGVSIVD